MFSAKREMLVHHAEARREGGPRRTRRQRPPERLDRARIGRVMAEEDVHQRRLARAVLAKKGKDLALMEGEADILVGRQPAEPLGDPGQPQHDPPGRIRRHQDDVGSSSLISVTNAPDRIAASRSATRSIAACGTLPSKVPSGDSEQPPSFMKL